VLIEVHGARAHGGPHRGLGRHDHVPRCGGRPGGKRAGSSHRVLGDFQCESVPNGRVRVEAHAEQQCSPCRLGPDRTLQHPCCAAAGVNAELLEAWVENRGGTGDPYVGCQGQVQAGAYCRPVDRCNRRQCALCHGEEAVVDHPQSFFGRLAQSGQVGARAECFAGAGQDHRVDTGVCLGGVDCRAQRR